MAITKSTTAVSAGTWQSGSVTASGTSLAVATSSDYADCVYITIVQVGTASTAATFNVQQSPDGSTFYAGATFTAGLAAATYTWQIALDPTCEKVQVAWTTQSGGTSSTITIQLGQVTAV